VGTNQGLTIQIDKNVLQELEGTLGRNHTIHLQRRLGL
jgi:hypothetical protein